MLRRDHIGRFCDLIVDARNCQLSLHSKCEHPLRLTMDFSNTSSSNWSLEFESQYVVASSCSGDEENNGVPEAVAPPAAMMVCVTLKPQEYIVIGTATKHSVALAGDQTFRYFNGLEFSYALEEMHMEKGVFMDVHEVPVLTSTSIPLSQYVTLHVEDFAEETGAFKMSVGQPEDSSQSLTGKAVEVDISGSQNLRWGSIGIDATTAETCMLKVVTPAPRFGGDTVQIGIITRVFEEEESFLTFSATVVDTPSTDTITLVSGPEEEVPMEQPTPSDAASPDAAGEAAIAPCTLPVIVDILPESLQKRQDDSNDGKDTLAANSSLPRDMSWDRIFLQGDSTLIQDEAHARHEIERAFVSGQLNILKEWASQICALCHQYVSRHCSTVREHDYTVHVACAARVPSCAVCGYIVIGSYVTTQDGEAMHDGCCS